MSYFSQSIKKSSIQPNLSTPSPFRYNLTKLSKQSCAQTPFGSTSRLQRSYTKIDRKNQNKDNVSSIEPYQHYESVLNQLSNLGQRQKKSTSVFVSKTTRFQTQKQQKPGPGQYNLLSERKKVLNNKNKFKLQKDHSLNASQFKVPSIPSDHLGYKQDQNNVMKKVLLKHNLQPHPGSYEIRTTLQNSRGMKWKNEYKPQKNSQQIPGPGSYQYKSTVQLKAPVSSFISQSKRFSDQTKNSNIGPGFYNPLVLNINKKSHSNNLQGNFNSKTSRFDYNQSKSKVGPGQYFNELKQRVKAKSMANLRKNIKTKEQQSIQKIVHKKTIFDEKNLNPGPGQYANTIGITFQLQKQLFRKFNDTTLPKQQRGIFKLSQNSITPGPGAYNKKREQGQQGNEKQNKLTWSKKKASKRTQVVNLKDYDQEITPSPFDYGNYTNTIENKLKHFENKMTLTDSKPFGSGEERFRHYKDQKPTENETIVMNQEVEEQLPIPKQLDYYQNDKKKVKKLVMTNIKVKVPFGSSSSKIKNTITQSPAKFYAVQNQWVKKSHNIRSKLN